MRINGTGCSLVDNLYSHVPFSTGTFASLRTRQEGDGGLNIGGLVFAEDLAGFAGMKYEEVLHRITGRDTPDSYNLGGPAIIPLVHAAQLLAGRSSVETAFHGVRGNDEAGRRIENLLDGIPVNLSAYHRIAGPTPTTEVFSDPAFDEGRGERSFVNRTGVAGDPRAAVFDEDFFQGDIVFFGGTGLVPPLHDDLTDLTRRARRSGAFVVITTVFDFRNHKRNPHQPWPLVDDYTVVDLVVTDKEEALRITGESQAEGAAQWFIHQGAGAAVVTQGTDEVLIRGRSTRFAPLSVDRLPVCEAVGEQLRTITHPHDTTGCGDNFVGGMLAAMAAQMDRGEQEIDLAAAVACGVVSGGFAATYLGGLYRESEPGEKRDAVALLWEPYRHQVAHRLTLPEKLPV